MERETAQSVDLQSVYLLVKISADTGSVHLPLKDTCWLFSGLCKVHLSTFVCKTQVCFSATKS